MIEIIEGKQYIIYYLRKNSLSSKAQVGSHVFFLYLDIIDYNDIYN